MMGLLPNTKTGELNTISPPTNIFDLQYAVGASSYAPGEIPFLIFYFFIRTLSHFRVIYRFVS